MFLHRWWAWWRERGRAPRVLVVPEPQTAGAIRHAVFLVGSESAIADRLIEESREPWDDNDPDCWGV